jgi:hypothetical protein
MVIHHQTASKKHTSAFDAITEVHHLSGRICASQSFVSCRSKLEPENRRHHRAAIRCNRGRAKSDKPPDRVKLPSLIRISSRLRQKSLRQFPAKVGYFRHLHSLDRRGNDPSNYMLLRSATSTNMSSLRRPADTTSKVVCICRTSFRNDSKPKTQ